MAASVHQGRTLSVERSSLSVLFTKIAFSVSGATSHEARQCTERRVAREKLEKVASLVGEAQLSHAAVLKDPTFLARQRREKEEEARRVAEREEQGTRGGRREAPGRSRTGGRRPPNEGR